MASRTLACHAFAPLSGGLRALFWVVMAALSALIVWNTLPFFTFADDVPFLLEKAAAARDPLWRACLYVHVAGGVICLLAALPQFSRRLLRFAPRLHRVLGWAYVSSVLGLVVPAGLYLALYAKGGFAGRLGFVVLGVALLYTTVRGVQHVRRRDFRGHVAWMLRSYAMASSAVSFRAFYLGLHLLGFGETYVVSIWLSFVVNLCLAELVIGLRRKGVLP